MLKSIMRKTIPDDWQSPHGDRGKHWGVASEQLKLARLCHSFQMIARYEEGVVLLWRAWESKRSGREMGKWSSKVLMELNGEGGGGEVETRKKANCRQTSRAGLTNYTCSLFCQSGFFCKEYLQIKRERKFTEPSLWSCSQRLLLHY